MSPDRVAELVSFESPHRPSTSPPHSQRDSSMGKQLRFPALDQWPLHWPPTSAQVRLLTPGADMPCSLPLTMLHSERRCVLAPLSRSRDRLGDKYLGWQSSRFGCVSGFFLFCFDLALPLRSQNRTFPNSKIYSSHPTSSACPISGLILFQRSSAADVTIHVTIQQGPQARLWASGAWRWGASGFSGRDDFLSPKTHPLSLFLRTALSKLS